MKKNNYLIIGAVIVAAIYFFKKKAKKIDVKPVLVPIIPIKQTPPALPLLKSVYPAGITEGMRVLPEKGDGTQYLIKKGKKYALTLAVWKARGYDPYIVVKNKILDLVPYGGLL